MLARSTAKLTKDFSPITQIKKKHKFHSITHYQSICYMFRHNWAIIKNLRRDFTCRSLITIESFKSFSLRFKKEIQGNMQRCNDVSCFFQNLQLKFRDYSSNASSSVPFKTSFINHLITQYYTIRVTDKEIKQSINETESGHGLIKNKITAPSLRKRGKPLNTTRASVSYSRHETSASRILSCGVPRRTRIPT